MYVEETPTGLIHPQAGGRGQGAGVGNEAKVEIRMNCGGWGRD